MAPGQGGDQSSFHLPGPVAKVMSHKQCVLLLVLSYHFRASRWEAVLSEVGSLRFPDLFSLPNSSPLVVEANYWVQGEAAPPWHPKLGDAVFTRATEPSFLITTC